MISGLENMFIQEGGKQRNQSYGGRRRRSRGTKRRGRGRGRRTRRH